MLFCVTNINIFKERLSLLKFEWIMKHFYGYIISGVIGGLVVLFGINLNDQLNDTYHANNFSRQVKFHNTSPKIAENPGNFSIGASKVMPVVVHISSRISKPSNKNSNNPFKYFFNDDSFNNPFGDPRGNKGTGSGVIYTTDGYIITNNHVVEFAENIEVTLFDNRKFKAEIVGLDRKTDLAVLKIDATDLPTLEIADSDKAQIGSWVLAVGNPFDLTSTVTAGIISAKGRDIDLFENNNSIEAFIQTDAAVNPGNSGGALVTSDGELLGINTAIATHNGVFSGYSFAIPVNLVVRIVDDIMENGSYDRPFLGIHIYPLNSERASELGVNITQGVVIDSLEEGGAAQYAGLLPKDIIVKVNNVSIKGVPELQEIVGRARKGDVLKVKILRKGKVLQVDVPMNTNY